MRDAKMEPLHEGITKAIIGGSIDERLQAILSVVSQMEHNALGMHDGEGMLCLALHDENRQVRWSAIMAISRYGSFMTGGLRMGLVNDDPGVRGMSAAMIHSTIVNNASAFRSMMLHHDERILGMAGNLLGALLDPQQAVRMHALLALRELARRSPVETLEEMGRFTTIMQQSAGAGFELECRLGMVREEALSALCEHGKKFAV